MNKSGIWQLILSSEKSYWVKGTELPFDQMCLSTFVSHQDQNQVLREFGTTDHREVKQKKCPAPVKCISLLILKLDPTVLYKNRAKE